MYQKITLAAAFGITLVLVFSSCMSQNKLSQSVEEGFVALFNGKDHPGLKRNKGYIGFLGHSDPLEFRNIRIKQL